LPRAGFTLFIPATPIQETLLASDYSGALFYRPGNDGRITLAVPRPIHLAHPAPSGGLEGGYKSRKLELVFALLV
jgi:hypothetical protein